MVWGSLRNYRGWGWVIGNTWTVDTSGNLTTDGNVSATGSIYGAAFDTNIAAAALNMSGTSIIAGGTDAAISINITPKGAGSVVMSRVDINAGAIDGTPIGAASPSTGIFTSLSSSTLGVSGAATFAAINLYDTDLSNELSLVWNENDTVDRDLNFQVNGASRTLSLTGDSVVDQNVSTIGNPTFGGLTITGLAVDGLVTTTTGNLGSIANSLDNINDGATYGRVLQTSLTTNEVTKLTDGAGDDLTVSLGGANRVLTLGADISLNQNLQTSDSPSFVSLNFDYLSITAADLTTDLVTLTQYTTIDAVLYVPIGAPALDDATSGGTFSGLADAAYEVEIDATAPDTFKWNVDGGAYVTGVAIDGTAQVLSNGVTITFGNLLGHTIGDKWTFTANAWQGKFLYCLKPNGIPVAYILADGDAQFADLQTDSLNTTTANISTETVTVSGISVANIVSANVSSVLAMTGRAEFYNGIAVASANDMTIGVGNVFHITGAVQINAITTAGWQAGSEITLIFDAAPTVKHNTAGGAGTAPLQLAGSADFVAAANSVLKLVYDGTNWHETSRKVA